MNTKVNYGEKLLDPRWISKKMHILKRDAHSCVHCKKSDLKLHVHHKQYHIIKRLNVHADPWDYADHLLITLCESCHSNGHRLYEVPVKYI